MACCSVLALRNATRAVHPAADANGATALKSGAVSASAVAGRAVRQSFVGAFWALFFSFSFRTGAALFAAWPASRAIRAAGGDPERIKRAAEDLLAELAQDRGARLDRAAQGDPTHGGVASEASSAEAAGDVARRGDQLAFYKDEPGARPGARPEAEPTSARADADAPRSRWDELRGDRTAQPSAWERIRQDTKRRAAAAPDADGPPVDAAAATRDDDRRRRQADFQALIDREAAGGDERGELERQRRTSRYD